MNFGKLKSFKNTVISTVKTPQIDKRIMRKFLLIVGSVSGAYLVIGFAVMVSLLAGGNGSLPTPVLPIEALEPTPYTADSPIENPNTATEEVDSGTFFRPPARTNVLVLGIDEFNLADVIIAGSFERDTGEVHLLSIPRDTFTQLPEERVQNMRDNGLWAPNHGMVKLNAVRSLGRHMGVHYMKEQLSETLGIEFHYYVEIELDAFREIVDLVGGVEIEVPRRMFYEDPCQDLIIDIPAGLHLMDGALAEQFVRYRGYSNADLGRISAQQQFMTQLFRQALRRETVMADPIRLARIAITHVQTDIRADLLRYIPYVGNLSPDRIFTYTLPGTERRVQGIGSTWVPDVDTVPKVINRMFFGVVAEEEEMAIPVVAQLSPSRNARIAVLNGTDIGGTAMTTADRLHMSGYQIVNVGPYMGHRQSQTRINIREEGLGYDLMGYFEDAVVRIDSRMSTDFDIVIIVGRSEQ